VCKIIRYRLLSIPIVYLDESGFTVDSPRTHGYAEKGQRCYAEKDWHARGRLNAIGAIVGFVLLTVCLFDCNIDSDVFYAWLTRDLLPKVPPNAVIVMDNATFHKRSDMIAAIKNAGHIPEYLPPYSPDLNPIEQKWAQVKSVRRKTGCTPHELFSNPNYANL
jgi:transposase